MKYFSDSNIVATGNGLHSISSMLFMYGLVGTLDYFCKISVFTMD